METRQRRNRHFYKLEFVPFQKSREYYLQILESILYAGVVCAWVLYYAVWKVWKASEGNVFNLRRNGKLSDGWNVFQILYQDVSCIPWKFWKDFILQSWLPYLVVYILLGQIVTLINPKYKHYLSMVMSSIMIGVTAGWPFLLFILAFTSAGYLVSLLQQPSLVWLFTIGEIVLFGLASFSRQWLQYVTHPALALVCVGSCSLRILSFGLERCKHASQHQEKKSKLSFKLVNLVKYNLYFPVFVGGPFISYDQFAPQLHKRRNIGLWPKLKVTMPEFVMCLSIILLVELATHFFYFHGLVTSIGSVKNLAPSTAAGIIFWCILLQYLTYFVLYEVSAAIARFDDVELPRPPSCVFSYFTFRDYWRCADRGMYNLVVKYIYIPFVQRSPTLPMKSLGALCCFTFMAAWQGGDRQHLIWAAICWFGIQVEVFAVVLFEMKSFKRLKLKVPQQLSRWLQGPLWCPVFILLIVANMLLIVGSSTWEIFEVLFSETDYTTWLMGLLFIYCVIQLCISRQMTVKTHIQ